MKRWVWVVVGAAAVWTAAGARADENFEPFPCEHDDRDDSSSSSSSSSSDDYDDDSDDSVAGAFADAFFSGSSSESSSSYQGSGEPVQLELYWPDELGIRLDAGYGAMDFSAQPFVDTDNDAIEVLGSEIHVGSASLAGGEIAVDLAPTPSFRLGAGLGVYGAVGGDSGGSLGNYSRFGENAVVESLVLIQGFVEAGFVQRVGAVNAFAVAHAGVLRADLEVSSDCGCNWRLGSTRFVFGPRLGLRTHLYRSLFVQAAVFGDVLEMGDYVATIGFGIGRRPR
jgi:hypothetical protein